LLIPEDKKMALRSTSVVVAVGLLLSACGSAPGDRAITGAGIGAAGGAIVGALVGAPAIGAALGASAGAVVGAATTPSQVDLGKPVWR
jgi:osmotically inducible lipoprotein OsmB